MKMLIKSWNSVFGLRFHFILVLFVLANIRRVHSHLNVYLNLHEVMRLIGVSAELYYVRDGQVNDYALNFTVPVPANVNEISFTWQSLATHPLPYSISLLSSDTLILPRPTLNITRIGEIPMEPQTFGVGMKCVGSRTGEVEITIAVEIILDAHTNNVTKLEFRRKKICSEKGTLEGIGGESVSASAIEHYVHPPSETGETSNDEMTDELEGEVDNSKGVHHEWTTGRKHLQGDQELQDDQRRISHKVDESGENNDSVNKGGHIKVAVGVGQDGFNPLLKETVMPPNGGLITLIVCVILALVLVTSLLLIAYCAKGPTKRPAHGVHLIKTASFQRLPTISSTARCDAMYSCPQSITPTYASLKRTYPDCEQQQSHHYQHPSLRSGQHVSQSNNEALYHRRLIELNVQKCRVRLSSLVQEGSYGRVYRGTYNECQEVLVKTVMAQQSNRVLVTQLLQDSLILADFNHPNILPVLGVSIEDFNTPFVLYAAGCNTRNLKLALQEPSYVRNITTIQTVLMASQLAMAMELLHSHGILHRDLATRNCVIDDQLRVKLCDSSLSRDLFSADYQSVNGPEGTELRPLKWMPLEAIQKKHYHQGSDVWSFGVLMWEICTLAKMPYAEIDPYEMEHYLKEGYRLAQPYNCPDELFTIMAYCWASLPSERPSFAQLHLCLSEFHTQITRYV